MDGEETGICYRPNSTLVSPPSGDFKKQECATGPNLPLRSVVGAEETGMYNTDQSHPWSQVLNNNNDDDNNNNEALF